MEPTVSIVLPVYNCPRYAGLAIESMLEQSWRDFELIVIDDGSTDETPELLRRYNDPRIRLISQSNRGLAATLNRGIEIARGRFVARQDQDDISISDRLGKQVEYLRAHPRCGLVGTWAEIWRENVNTGRQHRHPTDDSVLRYELLLNNPFVHSSVMLRKAALEAVGGYSSDYRRQPPEDYELWSRIARVYEVANLPEVLHIYREVQGSMSRDGIAPFVEHLVTISSENIALAANRQTSDPHVRNIACLVHGAPHQVKEKPDLRTMRHIFREAAEAVVASKDRQRIGREAEKKIDALRFAYPEFFGTNLLARKLTGLARRTAALFNRSER